MLKKGNISYKLYLFFSKIFDIYYVFVTVPYLCYLSENNNNKRILVFLNYIFFSSLNVILKIIIKRDRPCKNNLELDYYPQDYDIPSGHSLSGVFFSLFLIKKNGKNIINYIGILPLILQPVFRYFLKVHSTEGSIVGSLVGLIAYFHCYPYCND